MSAPDHPFFSPSSLALAALVLLAACAPLPPKIELREKLVEVPVPLISPADRAAQQLLIQHERLRALAPAELAQEIAAAGPAAEDGARAPQAAVQLALTLSLAHAETPRAQALLEQVQRSEAPEAKAWAGWARLLAGRLTEQRRLEGEIDKLNQQARDSQRRLDQTHEKLEALKAIERSLHARPAPAPGSGK